MGVLCDRLKLCSTVALDCRTGQDKGIYREKELLLLLVSLVPLIPLVSFRTFRGLLFHKQEFGCALIVF